MIRVCPFKKIIRSTESDDGEKEIKTDFGECNGKNCPYFYQDTYFNQHCMKAEEHKT